MSKDFHTEFKNALEQREQEGDAALDKVFTPVYDELRSIANRHLNGSSPATLQPTAIVHEVYLRLMGAEDPAWNGQSHFMALASRAMRQVLIDHHRKKMADKRGGDWQRVTLSGLNVATPWHELDFVALDEAIEKLEAIDPRQASVVQLRFFAGLTVEEVTVALGLSRSTVEAEWRHARAWLARELGSTSQNE